MAGFAGVAGYGAAARSSTSAVYFADNGTKGLYDTNSMYGGHASETDGLTIGAGAGASGGVFISNARCEDDLLGKSGNFTIDSPVSITFSVARSSIDNKLILSISVGGGTGKGLGISMYESTTTRRR
jgi:hypothetical protein